MTESDGMQEEVEAVLRVGLTAAGQFAERRARARAEALRAAADRSAAEARQLEGRLEAERAVAYQQLAVTHEDRWWLATDPKQIADTWRVAQEWRMYDSGMGIEHARMRREIHDRFGIDPVMAGGDPQAVAAELERWSARERADAGTAVAVVAADVSREVADRTPAVSEAAAGWDSAVARAGRADRVARAAEGDAEVVEAATTADTFQAAAPVAAVHSGRAAAVKKRRTRGRGAGVGPEAGR